MIEDYLPSPLVVSSMSLLQILHVMNSTWKKKIINKKLETLF